MIIPIYISPITSQKNKIKQSINQSSRKKKLSNDSTSFFFNKPITTLNSKMPEAKSIGEERRGLMKLEHLIRKLQLVLSLNPSRGMEIEAVQDDYDEELKEAAPTMVAEDVKEGHFAVLAVMGGEPKRFIVNLCYLTNPAFLRLLEQAEEEFGFGQKGTLAVPCQPEELQRILQPTKEPTPTTTTARKWAACRL